MSGRVCSLIVAFSTPRITKSVMQRAISSGVLRPFGEYHHAVQFDMPVTADKVWSALHEVGLAE